MMNVPKGGYTPAMGTRMIDNTYVGPGAGPPVANVGGITVPISPIRLLHGADSGNRRYWLMGGIAIAVIIAGYFLLKKKRKIADYWKFKADDKPKQLFVREDEALNKVLMEETGKYLYDFELEPYKFGSSKLHLNYDDSDYIVWWQNELKQSPEYYKHFEDLFDKRPHEEELILGAPVKAKVVIMESETYTYQDDKSDKYYTYSIWHSSLFDREVFERIGETYIGTLRWGRRTGGTSESDLDWFNKIVKALNEWLKKNPGYHAKFKFEAPKAPGQIMGFMDKSLALDKLIEKKQKGYSFELSSFVEYPEDIFKKVDPTLEIAHNLELNQLVGLRKQWDESLHEEELILSADKFFKPSEFNKILDKGFSKLWDGFNQFDRIAPNYLKSHGQAGAISAFRKQYKVDKLNKLLTEMDPNE